MEFLASQKGRGKIGGEGARAEKKPRDEGGGGAPAGVKLYRNTLGRRFTNYVYTNSARALEIACEEVVGNSLFLH